jgi:hypothetical protein
MYAILSMAKKRDTEVPAGLLHKFRDPLTMDPWFSDNALSNVSYRWVKSVGVYGTIFYLGFTTDSSRSMIERDIDQVNWKLVSLFVRFPAGVCAYGKLEDEDLLEISEFLDKGMTPETTQEEIMEKYNLEVTTLDNPLNFIGSRFRSFGWKLVDWLGSRV